MKSKEDKIDNFYTLTALIVDDVDIAIQKRIEFVDMGQLVRNYFGDWETKDVIKFFLEIIGEEKLHTAYEDKNGKLHKFI